MIFGNTYGHSYAWICKWSIHSIPLCHNIKLKGLCPKTSKLFFMEPQSPESNFQTYAGSFPWRWSCLTISRTYTEMGAVRWCNSWWCTLVLCIGRPPLPSPRLITFFGGPNPRGASFEGFALLDPLFFGFFGVCAPVPPFAWATTPVL